jgi:hypothetical protein
MLLKKISLILTCIWPVVGANQSFNSDDAQEDVKVVIQTLKAINVNPNEASIEDIRLCVDANYNEETDHSSEFIEALITTVQIYIQQKSKQTL